MNANTLIKFSLSLNTLKNVEYVKSAAVAVGSVSILLEQDIQSIYTVIQSKQELNVFLGQVTSGISRYCQSAAVDVSAFNQLAVAIGPEDQIQTRRWRFNVFLGHKCPRGSSFSSLTSAIRRAAPPIPCNNNVFL